MVCGNTMRPVSEEALHVSDLQARRYCDAAGAVVRFLHQRRGTARQLVDAHNLIDARNLADAHNEDNCPDRVAKFYDAPCPGVFDEVHREGA